MGTIEVIMQGMGTLCMLLLYSQFMSVDQRQSEGKWLRYYDDNELGAIGDQEERYPNSPSFAHT